MDSIAAEYGVCKGTVRLSVRRVEDAPIRDGAFALPGKGLSKENQPQFDTLRRMLPKVR
jgi:hypothetical protein